MPQAKIRSLFILVAMPKSPTPKSVPREHLTAGAVGFVIAGIRELQAAKVGDTVTESGVSFKILDCRSGGCSVEVTNPAA